MFLSRSVVKRKLFCSPVMKMRSERKSVGWKHPPACIDHLQAWVLHMLLCAEWRIWFGVRQSLLLKGNAWFLGHDSLYILGAHFKFILQREVILRSFRIIAQSSDCESYSNIEIPQIHTYHTSAASRLQHSSIHYSQSLLQNNSVCFLTHRSNFPPFQQG